MMLDLEKLCWLRFCRSKNIGSKAFAKLIMTHGSAKNAVDALEHSFVAMLASKALIEQEIDAALRISAHFLYADKKDYPLFFKTNRISITCNHI